MRSKITGGDTTYLFTAKIMGKFDVKYYRCNQTGFIQTEEAYWLDEAYTSAITKLDVGLPYRNINLSDRVSKLLLKKFDKKGIFLDYAGGYGLFTRLMRDKGFNFYHTDPYCQNLFAEHFDLSDLPKNTRFELVTAFEVFEHLPDPITQINKMLELSETLLFSTELQPGKIEKIEEWSYFSIETGQHIAFYNETTLKAIADKLGYNFYTDGIFLHLFTKTNLEFNPFEPVRDKFLLRKAKKYIAKIERQSNPAPDSLLMRDWQYIKDKINWKP
ncbi:class I SAM-dependent methyltransferase [Mucilaginibacter sp. RB4R14]|uniref:class I SAM-dependent methyltransferase n=1 Tax=Mucilaginibacter aurantiaciroseus TaxID=2949308 RepID=UPI002091712B|nr:class I SAM-dependent methyltransferase [Mucilaginibacter aurantiaciroseus]MCO5935620.1 class I SAM-dependent methyltransferase [Mucilaginibacter aurantiaciroseus]